MIRSAGFRKKLQFKISQNRNIRLINSSDLSIAELFLGPVMIIYFCILILFEMLMEFIKSLFSKKSQHNERYSDASYNLVEHLEDVDHFGISPNQSTVAHISSGYSSKYLYQTPNMVYEEEEEEMTLIETIQHERSEYEKDRSMKEYIATLEGIGSNMFTLFTTVQPTRSISTKKVETPMPDRSIERREINFTDNQISKSKIEDIREKLMNPPKQVLEPQMEMKFKPDVRQN